MTRPITVLILGLLCLSIQAQRFNIQNGKIIELQTGREQIFHGVNAVVKAAPFIPTTDGFDPQMSLSKEDVTYFKKWGFNFVRIGVQWEAHQTGLTEWNSDYLAQVEVLINMLGQHGIYTMVDAHQDIFSRRTCGEGCPIFLARDKKGSCSNHILSLVLSWAGFCKSMYDYGFRRDENNLPLLEDCTKLGSFQKYFITPETAETWGDFWANELGAQDYLAEHWSRVASKFAPNPYVLGYDLLNEPWAGNWFKNPSLLLPGKFEREVLQPFWQKLNAEIRKVDQQKIIFFEGVMMPGTYPVFGGIVNKMGFTETPGGKNWNHLEVLNDHHYCCLKSGTECDSGEPPLKDAAKCAALAERKLKLRDTDAKKLNVGLFYTEFGACSNSESCFQEITGSCAAFDKYGASWAYWMYKGYGDFTTTGDSNEGLFGKTAEDLQDKKIKALVRTYGQKYQGRLQTSQFDTVTANYLANFALDQSINAPTEIYYDTDYYYKDQNSVKVSVYHEGNGLNAKLDFSTRNHVTVWVDSSDKSILSDTKLYVSPKVEDSVHSRNIDPIGKRLRWNLTNYPTTQSQDMVTLRGDGNLPELFKIVVYGTEERDANVLPHHVDKNWWRKSGESDQTWPDRKHVLCEIWSGMKADSCKIPSHKFYHSRFEVRKNPESWLHKNLIWAQDEIPGLHGVELVFSLDDLAA